MAAITDPTLLANVQSRIRPRCDAFHALQSLGTDDYTSLNAMLPIAPSVSVGASGGNLTGAYLYRLGYVWLNGKVTIGPDSTSIVLASQSANLSGIPIPPAGVASVNIYRTAANDTSGNEKFVANIPSGTITFIDNLADTGLGVIVPLSTVLDGADVNAFTAQMFADYVTLLGNLLVGVNQSAVWTAILKGKVQPLAISMSNFARGGTSNTGDSVKDAIINRVRPRCPQIRAIRYLIQNDLNVIQPLILSSYLMTDVIADGRIDCQQLTIGDLNALLSFMTQTTSSVVNTPGASAAVDYACGVPVSVT